MPGKMLQLFLKGLEGKTTVLRIDEEASIKDLRQMIYDKTQINKDEMRILYCSKELRETDDHNETMYLSNYEIRDEGNLVLVLRLLGGSDTEEMYMEGDSDSETESEESEVLDETSTIEDEQSSDLIENISNPPLKVLDSDVELTSAPDMITLDDDKDGQRAKMACGHAIGPESLTAYCRSLLTNGKYEFRCPFADPYCGQLWEFYTIKRLAVLTKEELTEFETKIAMNYLVKAAGMQECPKCGSYCERSNRKDVRVVCPICTRKKSKLFEFCWFCLRPWLTNNVKDCGNINCSGEDPRKKILRDCPKKTVVEVPNCPSVRACPKCGLMIEHISACKQMVCRCDQKFCFICLKMASAGRYQCGAWNYKCKVAPTQTELP